MIFDRSRMKLTRHCIIPQEYPHTPNFQCLKSPHLDCPHLASKDLGS